MATISTLFYSRLWVWPIVMIVQTYGSCRRNIDNFVFDVTKENWTRCLYLIISFKLLNEITSLFFCWESNII